MARIEESMHGAFRGKVGKLVGGKWNGIDYVRSLGPRRNGPATPGQQQHRAKMAIVVGFARTIKRVVGIGFRDVAFRMSGYNAAVRHVMNHAITGEAPDFRINYSKVMVCLGEGEGPIGASASSPVKETVTFSWSVRNITGAVKPDDKAILVAYCEAFNVSAYTIQGPARNTGTGSLELPDFSGQKVHTWLAFVSADGKTVFRSTYTGEVTIT
jgi:hypothetical protein